MRSCIELIAHQFDAYAHAPLNTVERAALARREGTIQTVPHQVVCFVSVKCYILLQPEIDNPHSDFLRAALSGDPVTVITWKHCIAQRSIERHLHIILDC